MLEPPFLARLRGASSVLIAGAGGGFDVFCGIPLAEALRRAGKTVHLANLSFSTLDRLDGHRPAPAVVAVTAQTANHRRYFPEQWLSQWYADRALDQPIYCLERVGVTALRSAYQALLRDLRFDAIVLVDGGTDALMRGDEDGLGTPAEDMASIAAVRDLSVPTRMLVSLGFGVDRFHGVSNELSLSAIAELTAAKGFLGTCGLSADQPEVQAYQQACAWVFSQMPRDVSIVNSSILAALAGRYGDAHTTDRTLGSRLWINPLMPMYWAFDLDAVAARVRYLDDLASTSTWDEVHAVISRHRESMKAAQRKRDQIPD
jgi:hypothetical protein